MAKVEADLTNMGSPLLQLPAELLFSIFDFLPPVAKHTLALSCRRLRFTFAATCPELYPDGRHAVRTELARDGFPLRSYAYCNGCRSAHMLKFFSAQQLEQPPTSRLCSASCTQIWVEPGKHYSFNDFQGTRRSFIPHAIPDMLPDPNCSIVMKLFSQSRVWMHRNPGHNMWSNSAEQFAICASYDVLTLPGSKVATKEEMTRVLQGFHIPICPHTRLGDAVVLKSYVPSRHCVSESIEELAIWMGTIESEGAHACCRFTGCKTVFRWLCSPSPKKKGWKTLSIHFKRHLGTLLSPANPRWMAQAVVIPNEARLEAYWKACHQWKEVNMAIEEQRYERELSNQDGMLRRADHIEFEQLRRENDYLRHPHRGKRYPGLVLDYPSNLLDTTQPSDELPTTTLLLRKTAQGRSKKANGGPQAQAVSASRNIVDIDSSSSLTNRAQDANASNVASTPCTESYEDLFTVQYTTEAVLKSIDGHTRFDTLFDDHKAIAPWERRLDEWIWGGHDCLTMGNGLLGMMGVPYNVVQPRIRWLANQLYCLPRSVKRRLMDYEEAERTTF
ncbi:hypothetical protein BJX68DRAFT_173617 [Aspergillus pseudodeflectus]|uniref:F-box domain-containing protein n=1 Tax=Aspergillus pseudodeflectus TaxID=176178 RepID=A0ABR4JQS5_9EURO